MRHAEKSNVADAKLICETPAEIQAAALSFRALQAQVRQCKRGSIIQRVQNWYELHVLANKCEARNSNNRDARVLLGDNAAQRPLEIEGSRKLGLLRHGVNMLIETEIFGLPLSSTHGAHIKDMSPSLGEEVVNTLGEMSNHLDELGISAVPLRI